MHDINQYLGILTYIITILTLCGIMLTLGYFLGGRSYSRFKNVPFESGIVSIGDARTKFSIRFYIIAAVFVIFDVEGIYLYIWSVSIRDTGWMGFFESCIFILVLLISLLYVIRSGLFNWTNKSLNSYNKN